MIHGIGDKAYDSWRKYYSLLGNNIFIESNNIKNKLKELNLGYLITPINKRNT